MKLKYQDKQYERETQQTVLDCLLSHGLNIPNSCRSGVCCSCIMKSPSPNIPNNSQNGLKESLKKEGYFLACVCKPEGDFEVIEPDSTLQTEGEIEELHLLNDDVIRLRLKIQDDFQFKAGQYISLVRNDGLTRSYSIASIPSEGFIELHVRIIPNGKMSSWIRNYALLGEKIQIRGPSGHCYYSTEKKDQPILLAGTGTGLAPLYGILKDAILYGHTGPISLYHGGLNPYSLYLKNELKQLADLYPQFQYRPCVLSGGSENLPEIALDQYILKTFQSLKNARIYLCGDPALVSSLRKKLFISGASSKEIYADAFLPSLA